MSLTWVSNVDCLPFLFPARCFPQAHFPDSFLGSDSSSLLFPVTVLLSSKKAEGGKKKKKQMPFWCISPMRNRKEDPFWPWAWQGIEESGRSRKKRNLSSSCSQLWEGISVDDCCIRKRVSLSQIAIPDALLLPDALRHCQVGQVSLLYHLCVSICSQLFWMNLLNGERSPQENSWWWSAV